eukprot:NODE_1972_length_684_cov_214.195691_g1922_i0.p1 GENE.NODE_1972_length_684_cov_214.195691_g1922_i0~~NODE_1972_length_684_cov_214.195691_g1922_i0.p1  ORF type:complete len:187 (-),score=44.98 NODE_1972_length_684_cov_214.195691_g1922_i0:11-571(-)
MPPTLPRLRTIRAHDRTIDMEALSPKAKATLLKEQLVEEKRARKAAKHQMEELEKKRKEVEQLLEANHPTRLAAAAAAQEMAAPARRVFVRDYANNVILSSKGLTEQEKALLYHPNVKQKYKDADFGDEEDVNPGLFLGLAGRPSKPGKHAMKNQSVRRTRMYWDYQGRSYVVDLQDPPDMNNPYC